MFKTMEAWQLIIFNAEVVRCCYQLIKGFMEESAVRAKDQSQLYCVMEQTQWIVQSIPASISVMFRSKQNQKYY